MTNPIEDNSRIICIAVITAAKFAVSDELATTLLSDNIIGLEDIETNPSTWRVYLKMGGLV